MIDSLDSQVVEKLEIGYSRNCRTVWALLIRDDKKYFLKLKHRNETLSHFLLCINKPGRKLTFSNEVNYGARTRCPQ